MEWFFPWSGMRHFILPTQAKLLKFKDLHYTRHTYLGEIALLRDAPFRRYLRISEDFTNTSDPAVSS